MEKKKISFGIFFAVMVLLVLALWLTVSNTITGAATTESLLNKILGIHIIPETETETTGPGPWPVPAPPTATIIPTVTLYQGTLSEETLIEINSLKKQYEQIDYTDCKHGQTVMCCWGPGCEHGCCWTMPS